ncbi:hypothetical protein TTHERM_00448710 (macronuclear) [Tetrahymena thermophila SB210]|uniref:Uncharacterized protein n=1 Tax=Tetrahymena thermophila (strain SB210) TaxID=312017 RepID=Q239E4_TETTS|nr:hypothetical protein TTHERM_00448710 [Tetrahymena thermophila SB210]EAR93026.2 hypothetical protein TTHERM_00448710 [Tetrahymena thermophila SB210]|eukprot:XP_001013271.2 hypothetical protein TTHERM_00448710 [Tetrahymena thermophila SB210]
MESQDKKLTRKMKKDVCLELMLTGVHAVTHIPCHICNRELTSFFTIDKKLTCQSEQCHEAGECVCGIKEMQEALLTQNQNIEDGECDDLNLN